MAVMDDAAMVHAAGCVLWRRSPVSGGLEIALIHRPKWADWSLPKGKADPGEDAQATAVREVLEETGMTCVLGPELPTAHYADENGRPKTVRYWAAERTGGSFTPNREVSHLLWASVRDAATRLTHPRDVELITALLPALRASGVADRAANESSRGSVQDLPDFGNFGVPGES